ncbi:PaaI family thioesterase [Pontiellaceae bacterium B1224]|nr:PaaI family thioesterase [Pontiellaceae bacterium B1224]
MPENEHRNCLLCGDRNPSSLRLKFTRRDGGGVGALFKGRPDLQGYDGILHGGIIASLLDSAMTNCLFHEGIRAVTADLRIRYKHLVPVGEQVDVQAVLEESRPPLYRLKASILMNGKTMARGEARFMQTGEVA